LVPGPPKSVDVKGSEAFWVITPARDGCGAAADADRAANPRKIHGRPFPDI
jgi:hypothetical protein